MRLRQQESARRSVEAEALAARMNRQERRKARQAQRDRMNEFLAWEARCRLDPAFDAQIEADRAARQAAVYAPMTARIDASNPRKEWK